MPHPSCRHRAATLLAAALIAAPTLAACGSSSNSSDGRTGHSSGSGSANAGAQAATPTTINATSPTGTAVTGGTAYFAEQPLSTPDYIFPLLSGANYTTANANQFQTLLYRPLYWFGDQNKAAVDYNLSIANAPVYSDHNEKVTITLKPWRWSDGEELSARDVVFWMNLLKAEKDNWATYVPGGFPDNVTSYKALDAHTVQFTLNRSYNPIWFTDNELSQITPLPIAWDRAAINQPAPTAGAKALPDTTTAGAKAVYNFLNAEAKRPATYASSPIWSIVDGAWRLTALSTNGEARFVPNTDYSGPDRPRLQAFVELPFTSDDAEISLLRSASAKGNTSASQIDVGYVPSADLPQSSTLTGQGYRLQTFYPQGLDYFIPNFNNPTAGPIFKQLYFRQAFQHLIYQSGWIRAYYQDLAVPTYSAVPALPTNPYSNATAEQDPYPYSIAAAKQILANHGWQVQPNGTTTCAHPGTASSQCGARIHKGEALRFTLMFANDKTATTQTMADLQSAAKQVGIDLTLQSETDGTVSAQIEPCTAKQAACAWQLGNYGGAWYFQPDHYPSGEQYFQSGAAGNPGSYANATMDKLIAATETVPAAKAQAALNAYADYARTQLPVFWVPSPGTLLTLSSNLGGYVPNAYDFISPEEWYFVK